MLNPYLDTRGGYVGAGGPGLAFAPDRPLPLKTRKLMRP